jgi:hypothetical protein
VELIRDLLIFIAVMFALCIVLIVVISMLPDDNPLKRILTALSHRIGATLAAGMIAVPVEPIPGLDVLYDIAIPIALIWYWFTFFRDAIRPAERSEHTVRDVSPELQRLRLAASLLVSSWGRLLLFPRPPWPTGVHEDARFWQPLLRALAPAEASSALRASRLVSSAPQRSVGRRSCARQRYLLSRSFFPTHF